MRFNIAVAVLTLLTCTACSVKVAPVPTATGTINQAEQSITEIHNDVAFTVKLDELSLAPYQIVDNITSFHVVIDNRSGATVSYPPKAFLLKDSDGRQYRSISPERVREIVSKDTVYLIPYPYVGYYYLEDHVMMAHEDAFSSNMPFYAEYHPQDIFTRALTEEPVLKNSKVAGVVYFIADLENADYAEVMVFQNAEVVGEPIVKFTFSID